MADYDSSNIADSTDWLTTPLTGLSTVESALRCRVCRDFYKTPMITTCLHTFCSICIRRSLASDGKCPACRAPDQESKLRWNGALDEVVDAYTKTRPTVLSFARAGSQMSGSQLKRKLEHEPSQDSGNDPSRKRLRSSTKLSRTRGEEAAAEMVRQEVEVIEDSADEEYEETRDDSLAACPICHRQMKEYLVFGHLDKCNGPSAESLQSSSRELPSLASFPNPSPRKQQTKHERLPALNYSTLKDQALRKKMTELGISSGGARALLERRHREWRTIWNANCDAVKPKPRAQLIHDLDIWERTQGGRVAASRLAQNSTSVKDNTFDGGAWATKYNSSFKDLVANARRNCPPKQERDDAVKRKQVGGDGVADFESHGERGSDVHMDGVDTNDRPPVEDIGHEREVVDMAVGHIDQSASDASDDPLGSVGSSEQRVSNTRVARKIPTDRENLDPLMRNTAN